MIRTTDQSPAARRRGLVVMLALFTFLLSSCRSEITTRVEVGSERAAATLAVVVEGEAAAALRENPETDQRLMNELARRSGGTVDRKDDGSSISYRSGLPTGADGSTLTGVSVERVTRAGDDTSVDLVFVRPDLLEAAIDASVAEDVDAAAKALVMKRSTDICAELHFPGTVTEVTDGAGLRVEKDGNTAKVCSTLEALTSSVPVTVTGAAQRTIPILPVAAAGFVAVLVALLVRRRLLS